MSTESGQTLVVSRVLRAPANRIYRAFVDSTAMVKWMPPHGFTGCVIENSATVGGQYKMGLIDFHTGTAHAFGGTYVELLPGKRVRNTDRFDNPALTNIMETTVELEETLAGTRVTVTQANMPPEIPPEFATMGSQESFTLLEQLVTPEIPDSPGKD